jgi:hypothetical protein
MESAEWFIMHCGGRYKPAQTVDLVVELTLLLYNAGKFARRHYSKVTVI